MKKVLSIYWHRRFSRVPLLCLMLFFIGHVSAQEITREQAVMHPVRERVSIDTGWRFMHYTGEPDSLFYDERPVVRDHRDDIVADTRAQISQKEKSGRGLKKWILPTANDFIKDPAGHYIRPAGDPGSDFPFVLADFDDSKWQKINLPHDWAITGEFYKGDNVPVGGGMGRLPVQGVGWYRKKLTIPVSDIGKSIYLDIDGAMSYAVVWINGHLVGGWPYGYNSFRLDLTPFVNPGGVNQLAIRLDNPSNSSRWYPGGGIYRNVWLVKTGSIHIAHWGSFIRTRDVSMAAVNIDLTLQVENELDKEASIEVKTEIFALNEALQQTGSKVVSFPVKEIKLNAGGMVKTESSVRMDHPLLWGPAPKQRPHLYEAVTTLYSAGKKLDTYKTRFGVRSVKFDPNKGVLVNGKPIRIRGVNQHHDLGALGAAFNKRAAERQLEMLRDLGCNAIRLSHNPPAPELLDLTDKMGFLVIDEIFDCWEKGKTPLDFHLIFDDWHEPDLRSFIRRDRNHPSVIEWSFGNEVGEQYTDSAGAQLAQKLYNIVKQEDDTRPASASMNYAKPDMPFPAVMDVLSLNYQGEGIRDAPAYAHLKGIKTPPLYDAFRKKFPNKMIQSSETASTLSTRGTYIFPVTSEPSAPVSDSSGGDPKNSFVSSYGLYTAAFGASPDKVFYAQDHHPYVAGEFVWSGFDYLGEPTPYYNARSAYSGMIDLAGFKKDRFYLYQSRWRPDLPMAHILPDWTWPDRVGKITPVHVYTSGDEAELFLNGRSLGRKIKHAFEYRLRWDSVVYAPGTLKVVAYKNGKKWATDSVQTAGVPVQLGLTPDRDTITGDGKDLSFITLSVLDQKGNVVPRASSPIQFEITGPGEIVATDNGNPADLNSFASKTRKAFSGLALVIVRARGDKAGNITVTAKSKGIKTAKVIIHCNKE